MARFRSSPKAKVADTSASEAGTSAAPPTPCKRGASEYCEPTHEQAPPAVKVASAAQKEQKAPEGERVSGEDPLRVAPTETQLPPHRRQRNGHDREVEYRHKRCAAQQHQRKRLPPGAPATFRQHALLQRHHAIANTVNMVIPVSRSP